MSLTLLLLVSANEATVASTVELAKSTSTRPLGQGPTVTLTRAEIRFQTQALATLEQGALPAV
jgi:hypothetical protein